MYVEREIARRVGGCKSLSRATRRTPSGLRNCDGREPSDPTVSHEALRPSRNWRHSLRSWQYISHKESHLGKLEQFWKGADRTLASKRSEILRLLGRAVGGAVVFVWWRKVLRQDQSGRYADEMRVVPHTDWGSLFSFDNTCPKQGQALGRVADLPLIKPSCRSFASSL